MNCERFLEQEETPKKEVCAPRFLAHYRNSGNVRAACDAAGIGRATYYRWRESDPHFDAACRAGNEDALDSLEEVGWERAKESSDTLLIFFLKAGRPEKYRDHHLVEVLKRYQDMTDDELNQILAERLGALTEGREDSPVGTSAAGEE